MTLNIAKIVRSSNQDMGVVGVGDVYGGGNGDDCGSVWEEDDETE